MIEAGHQPPVRRRRSFSSTDFRSYFPRGHQVGVHAPATASVDVLTWEQGPIDLEMYAILASSSAVLARWVVFSSPVVCVVITPAIRKTIITASTL